MNFAIAANHRAAADVTFLKGIMDTSSMERPFRLHYLYCAHLDHQRQKKLPTLKNAVM
jgi:hypothetical protein